MKHQIHSFAPQSLSQLFIPKHSIRGLSRDELGNEKKIATSEIFYGNVKFMSIQELTDKLVQKINGFIEEK